MYIPGAFPWANGGLVGTPIVWGMLGWIAFTGSIGRYWKLAVALGLLYTLFMTMSVQVLQSVVI